MINDRTILSVILALLILFLFRLSSISNSSCPPTRFIATGNVSQNYQEIIADLIQQYDGLPKTSGDLSRMGRGQIYSVAEWHIIHSHVTRGFSLWHDLFDDDPTYAHLSLH